MYFDHLIQMHNGVIQALDLHLEVVYPISYISKAIPMTHPARSHILRGPLRLLPVPEAAGRAGCLCGQLLRDRALTASLP